MPEEINGDTKVILHRLDQLGRQVGRMEEKQDRYHQVMQDRLRNNEIKIALLEQSDQTICRDVENLFDEFHERSNRNDVIAAVSGAITGAGVAIATILGIKQ